MKNVKSRSIFIYHDLISAIVTSIEARDINTFHHSIRVSNMSDKICKLLELTKEETEVIHIAADLHDIGKIGVPDNVLLKKGSLNSEELNQMKMHPIIGYKIINKVHQFESIAEIILHHHERWDGKGYPDMLAGLKIPLGARIIAVADSIDAMLSNRSYRKGMSYEECYNEIHKNSGIMYDEDIVKCVLKNWSEILYARNSEK